MKKIWLVCLAALCVLNACAKSSVAATGSAVPAVSVTVQNPQAAQSPMPTQTPAASETPSPSASEETSVDVDYTFKGENTDWQGAYHVWGTVIYQNEDHEWVTEMMHDQFTVTYKKDISKLSKVKEIRIRYDNDTGYFETKGAYYKGFFKNNTYTTGSSGNSDAPLKGSTVRVTITLDNKKQVFELRTAN